MRTVLTILGAIFAIFIVILITAAVIFIPRAIKLEHGGAVYLQDAIPKIVTNWNSQELVDRATPELLATGSRDSVNRLFVMFQRLGSLKHLDTPEGTITSSAYTGTGTVTIGNFKAEAEFEKGPATISVQLERVKDTWEINGFHIYSDALLQTNL
jgi:hypothetical protein